MALKQKTKLVKKSSNFQKSIKENLPFKKTVVASLILAIITISITIFFKKYLPPEVPLFYGLPESENQIVSVGTLVVPGLISLAIFIANTTIAYLIRNEFQKKILILASLSVSIFSFITTLEIVLLVGSF